MAVANWYMVDRDEDQTKERRGGNKRKSETSVFFTLRKFSQITRAQAVLQFSLLNPKTFCIHIHTYKWELIG